MATAVKLPSLGEGITSADVVAVLVNEGDLISADQPVVELETDKSAMEIPAEVSGTVVKIHVNEGDKLDVGAVFVEVEIQDRAAAAEAPKAAVEVAAAVDAPAPSAPATPAPVSAAPSPAKRPAASAPAVSVAPAAGNVPAAPSVRRFAREIGIDVRTVVGTGPSSRISIGDVKAHSKAVNEGRVSRGSGGVATPPLPDFSRFGPVEVETMSNVRRRTAENMTVALQTVPTVTQFDKADITMLEQQRKALQKQAEAAGTKLTVTAILMKIVANALQKFPQFNASIDMENNTIIYKKYVNGGCAVDPPRGLLVPVLRDVDQKGVLDVAVELNDLAARARNKKVTPDEMSGGGITITNLGGIGGTNFTPIVNWPEVAILGVARGGMEPRWIDGEFQPRMMMPLSLSYDHRVIDGADGARFLRFICDALENPLAISL
jgi:pyruvate dehydrogenase E2 component (dihydrolipoamide acetyltransferase)